MKTRVVLFFTVVCAVCLCSCGEPCPPDSEHSFYLTINSQQPLKLKKVEAVGAIDTSFLYGVDYYEGKFWQMNLPLSLHTDSVTYIFDFDSRIDTLTVFYQRDFEHQDKCGFVMKVSPQKSKTILSTFQSTGVFFMRNTLPQYDGDRPVSIEIKVGL